MSTTKRKSKRLRERAMLIRESTPPPRMEVCASFSRKFSLQNYGGPQYESIDFFTSRKIDCPEEHSAFVTETLREMCVQEVEAAAREYLAAAKRAGWKSQSSVKPHPVAVTNSRAYEAWRSRKEEIESGS